MIPSATIRTLVAALAASSPSALLAAPGDPAALAEAFFAPRDDAAPALVGSDACLECHRSAHVAWSRSSHAGSWRNYVEKTSLPMADQIANVLGIEDFQTEARCITCHATTAPAAPAVPLGGVSCESCHGPASGWLALHADLGGATPGSETPEHRAARRAASVAAGMRPLHDPFEVGRLCYSCHVIPHEDMTMEAGHPPASMLEVLAWTQGEARHRFLASDGHRNEEAPLERRRLLLVTGRLAELEAILRAMGEATARNAYASFFGPQIHRVLRNLDAWSDLVIIPEIEEVRGLVRGLVIDADRRDEMNQAADLVADAAARIAAGYDGTELEPLDDAVARSRAAYRGAPVQPEASSLLGRPLFAPPLESATREAREARLAEALEAYQIDQWSLDNIIWLGRRLAYLGRYRETIAVLTDGFAAFPDSPRLLRHRGHRHITVRELDAAVADLERAASLIEGTPDRVEPDGLPNARNEPRSTLHTNVHYHLGLARYLRAVAGGADERAGLEAAAAAWRDGLDASPNDDMRVAAANWLVLALRRLGRDDEAAAVLETIEPEMDVIENHVYHALLRLHRGELDAADVFDPDEDDAVQAATAAYGVGAWHLCEGRRAEAEAIFDRLVRSPMWPAFGVIAAEAELAGRRDP